MKNEIRKTSTTKTNHTLEINRGKLLAILRKAGYEVPTTADAHMRIPGGGDWSNTDLDLDADSPLFITWETTTDG